MLLSYSTFPTTFVRDCLQILGVVMKEQKSTTFYSKALLLKRHRIGTLVKSKSYCALFLSFQAK